MNCWQADTLRYDCTAAFRRAARTLWFGDLEPENLLGQGEVAADVDLRTAGDETITSAGELRIDRDGTGHGSGHASRKAALDDSEGHAEFCERRLAGHLAR